MDATFFKLNQLMPLVNTYFFCTSEMFLIRFNDYESAFFLEWITVKTSFLTVLEVK